MDIVVAAALFIAAHGYGLPILRRLKTVPSAWLERALFAALLGCGVLTFLTLGVGLAGGLSTAYALVVLAVGIGSALVSARGTSMSLVLSGVRGAVIAASKGGPVVWGCWLFLVLSAGLNLIAALAPVSGTDVLAYHLAIPKLYAEEGRIRYVPGVYYATAAFGLEMLFTLEMLLRAPIAAQLTHFVFGLLAALAVYLLGVRTFSSRAGLIGATLFYAVTDVSVQSSIALIDLGAAAYLLAALLAALRWRESGAAWLLIAALLAGLHAGTKMPNLGAAGALWLSLAVDAAARRQLGQAVRPLVVAGTVVTLLALPWFARSWAWTGNPVYPYFNSTFHGRDFSPEASDRQLENQYYKTIGERSLDRLVLAPFSLTVTPDAFRSGYLGPIYLAFLPLLVLAPVSRPARFLLLFAAISLPAWYFMYPRLRTLLPVIGAISAPTAAALLSIARYHPLTRLIAVSTVTLWLITALAANARYHLPTIPVVFGRESADDFLRRRLPLADSRFTWYDDFKELNQRLPADARVLLWDTRGYHLERSYVWANSVAQGLVAPDRQRQPGELVRALRELGVTHVAMYPGDAPAGSEAPIVRLQYTLQQSGALREIYRSRTMVASELVP